MEYRDRGGSKSIKNIIFIVTKDCQLACKYCYLVGKNSNEKMTWEIGKQTIDYILNEFSQSKGIILDFIGGEPFLEIELIDRICDYFKVEDYKKELVCFNNYRFNVSTNGINYNSPKVQEFICKNKKHVSIGITIDGTKRKHDLNRIWKGTNKERGSYDDVVKNIPLWLEQIPNAETKVTISSADIPPSAAPVCLPMPSSTVDITMIMFVRSLLSILVSQWIAKWIIKIGVVPVKCWLLMQRVTFIRVCALPNTPCAQRMR